MRLFRPLTAEVPGDLLAAQVAASSRHAETATTPAGPDAWIPAPEYPDIWAALAAAGNNGVIEHTAAELQPVADRHIIPEE